MADNKPKAVEVRPLTYCGEGDQGVLAVKDEAGDISIQPYRRVDPEFAPCIEGPLIEDVVPSSDGWFRASLTERRGPVKVNSEAYRRGWERIFGKKPEVGEA